MRELPKIVKDAQRVRAMLEQAFTRMAHRHKYRTGSALCDSARAVVVACHRAWREQDDKAAAVRRLRDLVDELQLDVALAKDVNAFSSWREFEAIVRLIDEVSRQSGGWLKSLQPKGQNARAHQSPAQRAPILSSRAAPSSGVKV